MAWNQKIKCNLVKVMRKNEVATLLFNMFSQIHVSLT